MREFHFALNAKDPERMRLHIEGYRCVWNCEPEKIEEKKVEGGPIPWSDPKTWPDEKLPEEGDEVSIDTGVWVEFDIEETPLLKSLSINGRLTFKNNLTHPVDRTINAYWVHVRAGEFHIGNETHPYNGVATVHLQGDPLSEVCAFSLITEGGNKGVFVTGNMTFHG